VKPDEVVADEPLALLATASFLQIHEKNDITSYFSVKIEVTEAHLSATSHGISTLH